MIEIQNVKKSYKSGDTEFLALKGVSFKIEDGDFVAIMGPSGSGKSTLMHIIGALDNPTEGKYLLDGQDVSTLSEEQLGEIRKKHIGFVFQAFNLLPRTTVLRNVELPLMYVEVEKSERERLAKNALLAAGMSESHFAHLSNQLSGGQMQRVAIARALVNNPSLILADEPTGNLDTQTGEIVLGTFQKLNKAGHTVVLITHEREVAEHAQRVITLRDGLIVKEEINHKQRLANIT
jgi:putative ABC transport system ATP-binding protein